MLRSQWEIRRDAERKGVANADLGKKYASGWGGLSRGSRVIKATGGIGRRETRRL